MNIRRIVMMMLVLGCLVQGVSAYSYSVSRYSFPPSNDAFYCDEFNNAYDWFMYTPEAANNNEKYAEWGGGWWDDYWSTWKGLTWAQDGSAQNPTPMPSGSKTTTSSYTWIEVFGFCNDPTAWIQISSEPPNIAHGESCINGTFSVYVDDLYGLVLLYTFDDSYSFNIYSGLNYSIYFDTTDEWHNFTATASDHNWNPTCSLPSISGTITALDGEGIYNLNVTLNDWGSDVDSTFTDSNGSYRFYRADSGSTLFALSVSGYCNAGDDCTSFGFGTPFLLDNGTDRVVDYTWHIPQNVRIDLQYENGSAVSGALLNMNNLPGDVGAWKTTATDGFTTYTSMQSSKIYVDYHGGDLPDAGSDVLHSFQLTPNGQYRRSQFTVTIPDDYTNNTTIPVIPPPVVDDGNKTDITDMVGDSLFLVTVRDSETSAPLKDVTVTAAAADKLNYTGQWTGYTNTSGQWSFSKNYTVGEYDVSVQLKCYLPQTTTRRASATFDLVYSCGAPPGTDDNGTGGWQDNDSNSDWTFNNSMETENDVKNKLNSILYIVGVILVIILFATYFVKK